MKPLEYNRARVTDRATIETIQAILKSPITGEWTYPNIDPLTEWQRRRGLTPDGLCGPSTVRHLGLTHGADAHTVALARRFPGKDLVIDVSKHQKEIDWQCVKEDGRVKAVIVKVGGSDNGALYGDQSRAANLSGARAAGFPVGAYTYLELAAHGKRLPVAPQLDNAMRRLDGFNLDLPFGLDFETSEVEKLVDISGRRAAREWIETAARGADVLMGRPPMMYWSRRLTLELRVDISGVRNLETWWPYYPRTIDLDRAEPVGHPDAGPWTLWQFADEGKILDDGTVQNRGSCPGISGAVDVNVASPGALARLLNKDEEDESCDCTCHD
jgi:GH25 family lysozyme M1 (1,4-beta-N-acetylmuramidase)